MQAKRQLVVLWLQVHCSVTRVVDEKTRYQAFSSIHMPLLRTISFKHPSATAGLSEHGMPLQCLIEDSSELHVPSGRTKIATKPVASCAVAILPKDEHPRLWYDLDARLQLTSKAGRFVWFNLTTVREIHSEQR